MFSLPLFGALLHLLPQAPTAKDLQAQIEAQSGAKVVYSIKELPEDDYFGLIGKLTEAKRLQGLSILAKEVAKYPKGYLKSVGVGYIGLVGECKITKKQGFFPDGGEEGERYDGLWANNQTILLCLNDPADLAGTWHHEVFHAVDSTKKGDVDSDKHMETDNAAFKQAVALKKPYPAIKLSESELAELKKLTKRKVLRNRVSEYAASSEDEDQAETALYIFQHLPDSLIQMATQPNIGGTQRMLHVLAEYEQASKIPFNASWLLSLALAEAREADAQAVAAKPATPPSTLVQKTLASIEDDEFALSIADGLKILREVGAKGPNAISEELAAAAYLSLNVVFDDVDSLSASDIKAILNGFMRIAHPFLNYYLEYDAKTKSYAAVPPTDREEVDEFIEDLVFICSELSALGDLAEIGTETQQLQIANTMIDMMDSLDRYRHQLFAAKKLTRTLDKGLQSARRQLIDGFPVVASDSLIERANKPWKRLL